MTTSRRYPSRKRAAALAAVLTSATLGSAAQESPDAASSGGDASSFTFACAGGMTLNLQSNRSVCRGVSITDGEVALSANESTTNETSFERSEWQLSGGVRIAFESAVMLADQASFQFVDNEVVRADLRGTPVVLEDFVPDEGIEVRATAETIAYDREAGTARLEGEATIRRGSREFLACDVIYNFNDKRIDSESSACGGVRMVLPARQDSPEAAPPEGP